MSDPKVELARQVFKALWVAVEDLLVGRWGRG